MKEGPCYMVYWKTRVLTADRVVREGLINQVRKGGFDMDYEHAVSVGSDMAIEFHVKYRNEMRRIRANTKVVYCMVKSQNAGALLKVDITRISHDDDHVLNNILHTFGESGEFDLKV